MEKTTNQNAGGLPHADLPKPERGEVRSGADRPKRAETYAANIHDAEPLICKELPKLPGKRSDLVAGVKVGGKSGEEVVYEHPSDGKVMVGLLNRIRGKPVGGVQAENTGEPNEA